MRNRAVRKNRKKGLPLLRLIYKRYYDCPGPSGDVYIVVHCALSRAWMSVTGFRYRNSSAWPLATLAGILCEMRRGATVDAPIPRLLRGLQVKPSSRPNPKERSVAERHPSAKTAMQQAVLEDCRTEMASMEDGDEQRSGGKKRKQKQSEQESKRPAKKAMSNSPPDKSTMPPQSPPRSSPRIDTQMHAKTLNDEIAKRKQVEDEARALKAELDELRKQTPSTPQQKAPSTPKENARACKKRVSHACIVKVDHRHLNLS